MPTTLEPYERKRDFDRTPEPRPQQTGARENALRFVIYKHAARRLHYDFRFELDGVLKSWAVPKGPMLNPAQKHLAVHVEDHPLEYGEFEGQIPEGEYGAGDVVIWDRGKYAPLLDGKPVTGRNQAEALMRSQIESGMVKVFLMGEKLHGGWAFVRLRDSEKDWLLIKENDEFADRQNEIDEDDDSSVVSGRDLQRQAPASKTDGREIRAPKVIRSRTKLDLSEIPGAKRAPMPNTAIRPMLATLTDKPFVNDDWVFEPKLDGMRILAHVYGKGESNRSKPSIILYSRTGQDTTSRFPKLVEKLGSFSDVEMLLDGEIVAPDEKGAPSFQRLQPRINLTDSSQIQRADKEIPVYYLIFDVLHLDGYDLKNVPLEKRRAILESLIPASGPISLIAQSQSDGEAAYAAAITHGFEGVVAKRRDSRYETRRSHRWLKLKAVSSDEFIIGGYTHGTGRRAETFGALLMGQYDSQNRLVYSGHVGTGFDADTLHMLMERLKPLAVKKCPFSAVPPANAPAVWVEPELTAEIKFAIRTDDGILRAPVFLRLREDKPAGEVHPAEVVSAAQIVDNEKPVKKQSTSETTDGSVESILAQLNDRREELELSVDGQSIPVTNLDKTLSGRKPPATEP